jgi:hypothetical protein
VKSKSQVLSNFMFGFGRENLRYFGWLFVQDIDVVLIVGENADSHCLNCCSPWGSHFVYCVEKFRDLDI